MCLQLSSQLLTVVGDGLDVEDGLLSESAEEELEYETVGVFY